MLNPRELAYHNYIRVEDAMVIERLPAKLGTILAQYARKWRKEQNFTEDFLADLVADMAPEADRILVEEIPNYISSVGFVVIVKVPWWRLLQRRAIRKRLEMVIDLFRPAALNVHVHISMFRGLL